jgi:hypothetical protein
MFSVPPASILDSTWNHATVAWAHISLSIIQRYIPPYYLADKW